MNKALELFALAWIVFVFLANGIAIAGFFMAAPTFWAGLANVQDIFSPFNVFNWIAELIALSPALGAIWWLERRKARS